MPSPSYSVREKKEAPGRIKSEWLGAEARVHLPPRTLAGNRFMFWRWRLPVRILLLLLLSFSAGLALGGYLALFARGKFASRHLSIGWNGYGNSGEPFRASREVAPCRG